MDEVHGIPNGFVDIIRNIHYQDTCGGVRVAYLSKNIDDNPHLEAQRFMGLEDNSKIRSWRDIGLEDTKRPYIVKDGEFTIYGKPSRSLGRMTNSTLSHTLIVEGEKTFVGINSYNSMMSDDHGPLVDQEISNIVIFEIMRYFMNTHDNYDFRPIHSSRDSIPNLLLRSSHL